MNDKTQPISKQNVIAVILGNAIEFFDFGVYATFAVIIGQVFFPSENAFISLLLSVTTFGVGFIIRPVGAIVIGAYADRAGRKPAMLLTLVMMAIGTGGMAILPSHATIGIFAPVLLVIIRLLQGLAWGGEAGPATTYILEAAPRDKRGTYACWQVVAQGLAAIAAGLIGYFLAAILSHEQLLSWGWRIPFLIGLIILPIGLYIRRNLSETHQPAQHKQSTVSILKIVFTDYRRPLVLGLLILSGSTITQYFLNYMTTFAMTELKMPDTISMLAALAGGIGLALGAILGGVLCDRFGRRPIIIIPRLILLLVLFPVLYIIVNMATPRIFLLLLVLLSLLHGTSGAALIVLLVESFPKALRSTGFSIVYAVGVAFFGGTAQIVVTWIIKQTSNPLAPIWYLIIANVICVAAAYLAKETRPQMQNT